MMCYFSWCTVVDPNSRNMDNHRRTWKPAQRGCRRHHRRNRVALRVIIIIIAAVATIACFIFLTSINNRIVQQLHYNSNSHSFSHDDDHDDGQHHQPHHGPYILWSNEETHFADCRQTMIGNQTWGDPLAPLVDKVEAKRYAQQWSPSVRIVPTLATLDVHNISFLTSQWNASSSSLPQPYIIKPSHMTGLVLRVLNNTLTCIKGCNNKKKKRRRQKKNQIIDGNILDDPAIGSTAIQVLADLLRYDFSTKNGQMQYHPIAPRIVLEQYLPMNVMRDVTYWYMARGKTIFVSMECADPMSSTASSSASANNNNNEDGRIFLTSAYQPLPVTLQHPSCRTIPSQPKSWERMRQIAEQEIGPHIAPYGAVVRLDLYAGDSEVYFSEFTFTTNVCGGGFRPRVADGLLYAVHHGVVSSDVISPNYVYNTLWDTSWIPIFVQDGIELKNSSPFASSSSSSSPPAPFIAFPSPVDLCLNMPGGGGETGYSECIDAAKTVATDELRCIVYDEGPENGTSTTSSSSPPSASLNHHRVNYRAIGARRYPSFSSVWSRVPQDKIGILAILFCLTKIVGWKRKSLLLSKQGVHTARGKKKDEEQDATQSNNIVSANYTHQRCDSNLTTTTTSTTTTSSTCAVQYNRFWNNIVLYHSALVIYMYYTTDNDGVFSSQHSLTYLMKQSFQAFRIVHPISSPMIILSHFATYWLNVAAWTAPSLQSLFLRQLIAELIPPLVNEYTHRTEALENVRCMRLVFIDSVQRHVMDEVIRGYVLPQFFVYGYLLPKFVLYHMGLLSLTGDSFLSLLACQCVLVSVFCYFWILLRQRLRWRRQRQRQIPV